MILDPSPGSAGPQRLWFLRWIRTAAGLRVLCRGACGRAAVVRAGDYTHGRVRCWPGCWVARQ